MLAVMAAETALSAKIALQTGMFNAPTPPVVVQAWVGTAVALGVGFGVWAGVDRVQQRKRHTLPMKEH